MRTINRSKWAFIVITILAFFSQKVLSQDFKLDNNQSTITIYGTSSLHDWDEAVREQSGTISISNEGNFQINSLVISVVSESLKSYKSGMDKNTYKALKTDVYKTIDFKMVKMKDVKQISETEYKVNITGKLTITSTTNSIDLPFKLYIKTDQILLEGEKNLKMTDYGIEPPKALLGTIKTGDDITVKFKSIFKSL